MFVYKTFEDLSEKQKNLYRIGLKYIDAIVATHNTSTPSEDETKYCAGMIGMVLFKFPIMHTGLISVGALNAVQNNEISIKRLCLEHFHSRAQSGRMILREFSSLTNIQKLDILVKSCHVHRVLPSENQRLRRLQEDETLTWEDQYKNAGVELVHYKGQPQKGQVRRNYVYTINGMTFNKIIDIASHFNIEPNVAYSRVYQNYKPWNLIKQEINNV
jgi:hypothetical protein